MEILGDPTNTRMFSFNKNTACIQSGLCLCDAEQKQQQKKRFLTLLLSIFEQSLVLNLQHLCEQSNISQDLRSIWPWVNSQKNLKCRLVDLHAPTFGFSRAKLS